MLGSFLIGRLVGDHLCFDLLTLQTNGTLQVLGWQRTGSTKPLTLLSLRVNGIERPMGVQRHERPDVPDVRPSGFCLDANVGAETIRTIELLWEGDCIFSKSDV
jgi:hypothetical protein